MSSSKMGITERLNLPDMGNGAVELKRDDLCLELVDGRAMIKSIIREISAAFEVYERIHDVAGVQKG